MQELPQDWQPARPVIASVQNLLHCKTYVQRLIQSFRMLVLYWLNSPESEKDYGQIFSDMQV